MSYYMGSHMRLCATCEYWIGTREPNTWASGITIADQSCKGKCWCLNGPHARADRFSNSSACSCYRKWLVLK